ncbi:unnamed protein product [Pylaiella littoralis]
MAVPSIQEKLKLEAERRQKQRLDNEDLRGQLVSFAEQTKLSKKACAAQLTPASLRIEMAKAKCEQQEAKRRAGDPRADSLELELELEGAKASHTKLKADTIARERSLSKIQNILNERKSMSATLQAKESRGGGSHSRQKRSGSGSSASSESRYPPPADQCASPNCGRPGVASSPAAAASSSAPLHSASATTTTTTRTTRGVSSLAALLPHMRAGMPRPAAPTPRARSATRRAAKTLLLLGRLLLPLPRASPSAAGVGRTAPPAASTRSSR